MVRQEFFSLSQSPYFHCIDFYVAERMLRAFPDATKENAFFLAFLMAATRQGNLCVILDSQGISPDFGMEFADILLKGSAMLPQGILEKNVIQQGHRFYLSKYWGYQQRFLNEWQRLCKSAPEIRFPVDQLRAKLMQAPLSQEQQKAILHVAQNGLTLIAGGPGTGKTFTARHLISIFLENMDLEVAIAAPTGKAAANLRERLPSHPKCSIQTLHTLLGVNKRGDHSILSADLVLVDEASMIDAELMTLLFSAIKEGARLVLVGDPHQLLPVESGHFFVDLYHAHVDSRVELTTCLRTEETKLLTYFKAIQNGEIIPSLPLPSVENLIGLITKKLKESRDTTFQVLTPLRKGPYGVDNLNALIYAQDKALHPSRKIPIVIQANDPSLNLWNGDIGMLDEQTQMAYFSTEKNVPKYRLPAYEYAYVISVHKSQGSEYGEVWLVLPEGADHFGREMLYTACSRAKKSLTVFANNGMMEKIVAKKLYRHSGFD